MTKIPEWRPTEELRPTPRDPKSASLLGEQIEEVGQDFQSIGSAMEKVQAKTQSTQAETKLIKRFNEIHFNALQDRDPFKASEKLDDDMTKAVLNASEGIGSQEAREKFQDKANLEMARRSVSINNALYARQLQTAKSSVFDFVDQKQTEYQNLADPGERGVIRNQITEKVNDAVETGVFNAEAGRKYLEAHLKNMDISQVRNDISLDPVGAYRELQKGKDGIYSYLQPHEQETFMKSAEAIAKRRGQEDKEIGAVAKNTHEAEAMDRIYTKSMTEGEITKGVASGIYSKEFGNAAMSYMEMPLVNKTDPASYMNMIDKVLDLKVAPEEAARAILTDKGLTKGEKERLYSGAYRIDTDGTKKSLAQMIADGTKKNREEILRAQEKDRKAIDDRKNVFSGIVDNFKKFWNGDQEKTAGTTQKFVEDVVNNKTKTEDLHAAAHKAMGEEVAKMFPDYPSYEKTGRLKSDGSGNYALVYPDKTYREISKEEALEYVSRKHQQ